MEAGEKWDLRLLRMAGEVASWSKDSSTKVGCVITTQDYRILSTGFNGLPRDINDDQKEHPERHDRDQDKYAFYEHAERNAIYNAAYSGVNLCDSVFFITMAPCMDCARGLIQVGASLVVWDQTKTDLYLSTGRLDIVSPLNLLGEAGIPNLGLRTRPQLVPPQS